MPYGYNVPVIDYGGGYQQPKQDPHAYAGNIISNAVGGLFPQYPGTPWSQITNNPIGGMTAGLFNAPGMPVLTSPTLGLWGPQPNANQAGEMYNYNQQYWENPANHPSSQLPTGVDPNNPPPYTGWQRGGGGTKPQVTPPAQGGYGGGQYGGAGPGIYGQTATPTTLPGGYEPGLQLTPPAGWTGPKLIGPPTTLPTAAATPAASPGLAGVPQSSGLPDYNALMQWLEGMNEPNFNMGGMSPAPGGPTWGP